MSPDLVRDETRDVGGGLEVDILIEGRHSLDTWMVDHLVQITAELRVSLRLLVADPGEGVLRGVRQEGGNVVRP